MAALVASVTVATAVALCGWQWSSDGEKRASLEAATRLRAAQLAKAVAGRIALLVGTYDVVLLQARNTLLVDPAGFPKAVDLIARTLPADALLQVSVADQSGEIVYSNPGAGPRANIADLEDFRAHAEGADRLYISKPLLGRISQPWSIRFSRPVLRAGRFDGVIVLSVSPTYLSAVLATLELAPEDNISLVHADGSYLARSRRIADVLGRAIPPDRPFLRPGAPPSGSSRWHSTVDGTERLFGWSRVAGSELLVSVGLDAGLVFAPLEEEARRDWVKLALLVGVLGTVGSAAFVLHRRLAKSRRAIMESEARFSAFMRHAPVTAFYKDEAGRLLYINEAFRQAFDFALGDWHGKTDAELWPRETAATLRRNDLEILRSGTSRAVSEKIIHPDGEHDWLTYKFRFSDLEGRSLLGGMGMDRTAELRIARELDQTRARLELALQNAGATVWEADLASGWVELGEDWSEAALEPRGPRRSRIGRLGELIHPDDVDVVRRCYRDAVKGHAQTYRVEHRVRAAAGTWRWILSFGRVVERDPASGRALRMTGINLDITGRKQAAEALVESELRLRAIFEQSPLGIALIETASGRLEQVNRKYCEIMGRTAVQLQGRSVLEITHPEDLPFSAQRMAALMADGAGEIEIAKRYLRPGGEVVWVSLKAVPLRHADAAPTQHLAIVEDITARRRSAQAARIEHAVSRDLALAASESDGLARVMRTLCELEDWDLAEYWKVDPEAKVMRRSAHWLRAELPGSREFVQRSGQLTFAEGAGLVGAAWQSRAPIWLEDSSSDPRVLRKDLVREAGMRGALLLPVLLERRVVAVLNFASRQMRAPDALLQGTLISLGSQVGQFVERKRIEAALRELNESLEERVRGRTKELSEANRELESFSYTISHDLRAPLRAMASFSALLREKLGPERPAEAEDYLQRIEKNAVRMGLLIDDLLAFSRAGRGELERRAVDMGALVEEVRDSLAGAGAPGATFAVGALPRAHCDPLLMRQVWTNLIDNALKFSQKAAQPRIEIGGMARDGMVEYWVKDNGIGYDPAHAGKLWGVFERLHTAAEAPPGTGIGLAIVKRIVERHGGTVRAEGAPGKGATFGFSLPG